MEQIECKLNRPKLVLNFATGVKWLLLWHEHESCGRIGEIQQLFHPINFSWNRYKREKSVKFSKIVSSTFTLAVLTIHSWHTFFVVSMRSIVSGIEGYIFCSTLTICQKNIEMKEVAFNGVPETIL